MVFLVISYNYNQEASGNMTKRIVKSLIEGGHVVHLLTASCGKDDGSCYIHTCKPLFETNSMIYRIVRKLYKSVFKDSEEYHPLWNRKAVNLGLSLINSNHIDIIYSRSSPVEANYVGYKLGKETGVPVCQHFSDPYPTKFVTYSSLIRRFQAQRIKKVIENSYLVSYGNDTMLSQSLFEIGIRKDNRFFVSPDPCEEKQFHYLPKSTLDKNILVYLGGFGGQRNPVPLYSAIENLNDNGIRVELHMYTDKPLNSTYLPDSVIFNGRQDDIEKALQDSTICIDLGIKWEDSPYISSKLKDYLSVDRPIISITTGHSASGDFLANYKSIRVVENDSSELYNAIKEVLQTDFNDYYLERENLLKQFYPSGIVNNFIGRIKESMK